jgi:hypothetical protein
LSQRVIKHRWIHLVGCIKGIKCSAPSWACGIILFFVFSCSFSDRSVLTPKCLPNLRHQKVCGSALVLIDYGINYNFSNHVKMPTLSCWVNPIPLYVNWIVPRRSPWGATSFEELTSTLYRWVSGCHFLPSWGGVGICLV